MGIGGCIKPDPVQLYKSFIIHCYENVPITRDQWLPVKFQNYVKLATVLRVEDFANENDCIKAMINGNLQLIKEMRRTIEIEQIGRLEDNTQARCIIVEGIPGVGKSTLAWQLGRRWGEGKILPSFSLVVVIQLRDERIKSARTISDLFYHPDVDIQKNVCEWVSKKEGEKVLLILDGYDELPSELQTGDQSIFARLIKGEELPKITILVTSRHSASRSLYQLCRIRDKCQYIEIVGFGEVEIKEYIEHSLNNSSELMKSFQTYIEQHPHIHSLMYVPINCAIIVELFREHRGNLPQTLTEVYLALTSTLLKRHEHKTQRDRLQRQKSRIACEFQSLVNSIQDPSGLADALYSKGVIEKSVKDQVHQRVDLIIEEKNRIILGAVEAKLETDPAAYQMLYEVLSAQQNLSSNLGENKLVPPRLTCLEDLLPHTMSDLKSIATIAYEGTQKDQVIFPYKNDRIETLGLMQKIPQIYSLSSPTASYNFLHKTLQEFLTAWHVSNLSTSEQKVFVNNSSSNPNMDMIIRFMAGLSRFKIPGDDTKNFSDTVIPFEKEKQRVTKVENLQLMFETQNPALIRWFLGNNEQTFSSMHANPFDLHALAYCIVHSSKLWSVSLANCNMADESIAMLFSVEEGKALKSITSLDLGHNNITRGTALQIGLILKNSNTMKTLILWDCKLQPEGFEVIFNSLQANKTLEILNLSSNVVDNKTAHSLGLMLETNNALKDLKLSDCKLQPEGLEKVFDGVLKHSKLESLDLSNNTIDDKSASRLGCILKENSTLKSLALEGCKLQAIGLEEVLNGVWKNTKLETLILSGNTIDTQGGLKLANVLNGNATLSVLILNQCGLGDGAIQGLCNGLQHSSLKTLECQHNTFGDVAAKHLKDIFAKPDGVSGEERKVKL